MGGELRRGGGFALVRAQELVPAWTVFPKSLVLILQVPCSLFLIPASAQERV